MLYAYHKTHLHTTKVVMILIPSSQGVHYIGTPETMADIAHSVLGIPIPKSLEFWASPSHITAAFWASPGTLPGCPNP